MARECRWPCRSSGSQSRSFRLFCQLSCYLVGYIRHTSPELRTAAREIIGNLDEDGFLRVALPEMAQAAKVSADTVTSALDLVQSFHPPGVAARTLPEALLLQLHARGRDDSLEARIVRDHFELLGKRKFTDI
ncbi:MAG: hypothetical protein EBY17_20415, partial [Acidobacteriia bacterium]|nr:hypothetical protein [Terriglobia bacterium]